MAHLKSINKYASAPAWNGELPAEALVLVEVGGKVYKLPTSELGGEGAPLPGWVTDMPTSDPEVDGQVYASGDTLLVSAGAG